MKSLLAACVLVSVFMAVQEVRYTRGPQLACDEPGHVLEMVRLQAEESKRQYSLAGTLLAEEHCRALGDSTRVFAFPTRAEAVVRIRLAAEGDTASYYLAAGGLR